MKAYAIARLENVRLTDGLKKYLQKIDDTLRPFGGRFLVHGAQEMVVAEGNWKGDIIVIEFPDREQADAWYQSEDYQAIIPYRTQNADGDLIIVTGTDLNHKATDIIAW